MTKRCRLCCFRAELHTIHKMRTLGAILAFLLGVLPAHSGMVRQRVFARIDPNVGAVASSWEIYDPTSGFFQTAAGATNARRARHTATRLQNGKVLIAGGFDGTYYLSTAEIYNPATGKIRPTSGKMTAARGEHAAALLADGSVLITGGFNGAHLQTAEIYNPATDIFTAAASMTGARSDHTATTLPDGKVLISGGYNNGSHLKSAELYDPTAESFAATGEMKEARSGHSATLWPSGAVLLAGGSNDSPLKSAELYDYTAKTFTSTGAMAEARTYHSATLLTSGRVLIAGGTNGSSLASAELYDPGTRNFAKTGSMTEARSGHTATLIAENVALVAGGVNGSIYFNTVERYSESAGAFSIQPAAMAEPRAWQTATLLSDGRLLLGGGTTRSLLVFDVNLSGSDNISPNVLFTSDSSRGIVAYTGSGAIVFFSAETGEILRRIPTGGRPTFGTPLQDGRTVLYVSALEDKIFRIDTESGQAATYRFPNSLFGFGSIVTTSPDGNTGFVSSTGTGEVIKFQVSDGKEIGSRLKGLQGPAQITLSLDGQILMVVDTMTDELVFADAVSMTRKYALAVREKEPNSDLSIFTKAVLMADGSSGILVARPIDTSSLYTGTAFIFDPATGNIKATEQLGINPSFVGLTPDSQKWVVLNDASLSVIPTTDPDALENQPSLSWAVLASGTIAFSPDSRFALYPSSQDDLVIMHDLHTGAVVSITLVGDDPDEQVDQTSTVALTPDGKILAALNFATNTVELLKAATAFETTQFSTGGDKISGLTLINLSLQPAQITLSALDNMGSLIAGDEVSNPVQYVLAPNAQLSAEVSQIFNLDTSTETTGRLEIVSDRPNIVGYQSPGQLQPTFLGFILKRLDGLPILSDRLHDWIVPEVVRPDGSAVELNFVSPDFTQGTYSMVRLAGNGAVIESRSDLSTFPRQRQAQPFSEMFTQPSEGYALVFGGHDKDATGAEVYDPATGGFIAASAPVARRSYHTATLLQSGKVLFAGGKEGEVVLGTAELLDRTNGVFAPTTSPMTVGRSRHTATSLASGKILLAGGLGGDSVLRSTELFDPATGAFSATGEMSVRRHSHTATLLWNGRVLIAGGIDENQATASAELYEPDSGTFIPTGSLSAPRARHEATLLPDGRVLITGGEGDGYLDIAEIYDPAAGVFTPVDARMNLMRSGHTATLLANGNVLLAGGYNGAYLNAAELFLPSTGSFEVVPNTMTRSRSGHTATLLADGKVLIAGGADSAGAMNAAELYNPEDGTFAYTASMASARDGHTATILESGQDGHLRITSRQGLLFSESFGGAKALASLNGINVNDYASSRTLVVPQFAIGFGFQSILNLINANEEEAEVHITLMDAGGAEIRNPHVRRLAPGAQLKVDLAGLFGSDLEKQGAAGWLKVESSVERVVGTLTFSNSQESFLTSTHLGGVPQSRFVFPMAANDESFQTGIALLNNGPDAATVTMELWGPDGTRDSTATFHLPAGTRFSRYLSEYFPGIGPRLVGNVRVFSDRPIHGMGVVHDLGLNFLAALPAMPFPPENDMAP